MSRIKKALGAAGLISAGLAVAGVAYQMWGRRRDRRRFPAPGRHVTVGKRRMHVQVTGSGSPTVVFESGIAASSLSWRLVQPQVGTWTQTVSYDRAGLGWSDGAGSPRALRQIVDELRGALDAVGVGPPYILVGHSFGGLVVRAFAAWFPREVSGLILLDPVLPSEFIDIPEKRQRELALGARLSRRGAWLARVGLVRIALDLLLSGSPAVPRTIARIAAGRGSEVTAHLAWEVGKLPPEMWPLIRAHWCDPKSFGGMASYLEILAESAKSVAALDCPAIPLTILSASGAPAAQKAEWDRLTGCSALGKHVVAERADHWIQFDRPDLVIAAIEEMIAQLREVDVPIDRKVTPV